MTRDEAIAFIKFGLGNRTDTGLDAAIVERMKQAQRLLEQGRSLPYFLKQEDASFALPSGNADVAFPSGFLREIQNETFHYTSTTSASNTVIYLKKVNPREGNTETFTTPDDPGRPRAYAIMESGFRFFPTRNTAYSLTFSYYKTAGTLDSNVADNAWLVNAPDVLIGRAGALIAEVIAHDRAKAAFDQQFMIAWQSAFAETVMREEENDPLRLGARL
jgi:hypothetical protein